MPKHKKEEVDARIEEVGRQRARRVPVAECARRFDVSERQIRDDQREWLKRRKAERATEGLEVEERLAQCDEALQAAWRDYDLLGNGAPDPKVVRARSELLRLALSIIDRQASFLGPSIVGQGATAEVDSNVDNMSNDPLRRDEVREMIARSDRLERDTYRRMVAEAWPSGAQGEGGGGDDGGT
jgi:hypothetical protein